MNAADVIDAQADLLYRLTEHDAHGHRARYNGDTPLWGYFTRLATRETGSAVLGTELCQAFRAAVAEARAYRVQENMTAVVDARARTLPAGTVVDADRRPPRPHGFVRFDEPLRFGNLQGHHQAAHWLGWTQFSAPRGERGWVLTLWNDIIDGPDETIRRLWAEAEAKDPDAYRDVTVAEGHREMFGRWGPLTIGYIMDGARVDDENGVDGAVDPEPSITVRTVLALWEMLGETVPARETADHIEHVDVTDEHLPRTLARRARRDGLLDPAVTTVVLRRESRPTRNPGSGTPWDSRVWIDGYEAWRWVGPRHDRRKVRRWIAGHWSVGDESLPVRQRKIVSELRR